MYAVIDSEDYKEEEFALLVEIGENEIGCLNSKSGISSLESWSNDRSSKSSSPRYTYITETLSHLLCSLDQNQLEEHLSLSAIK